MRLRPFANSSASERRLTSRIGVRDSSGGVWARLSEPQAQARGLDAHHVHSFWPVAGAPGSDQVACPVRDRIAESVTDPSCDCWRLSIWHSQRRLIRPAAKLADDDSVTRVRLPTVTCYQNESYGNSSAGLRLVRRLQFGGAAVGAPANRPLSGRVRRSRKTVFHPQGNLRGDAEHGGKATGL